MKCPSSADTCHECLTYCGRRGGWRAPELSGNCDFLVYIICVLASIKDDVPVAG